MMDKTKISFILVNYNVKYFLEQCLHSIVNSSSNLNYEIMVVDNASIDNSKEYIESKFKDVKWIQNDENLGFSKANNIAVSRASGTYLLFLNPDTIVDEEGLSKALDFLDTHPSVGALGAKMIDGSGTYLSESKRGLPTAWTALTKVSRLYRLFPKSRLFNNYYLGHLSEDEINEVEVLSGAFMLVRSDVYQKVGGFDERYFMYAEDIDLSYQISQAGYKVVYFPDTKIIHFKGESTKKSSLNYNKTFYQSMILFMEKYRGELFSNWQIAAYKLVIYILAITKFLVRNLTHIVGILPFFIICLLSLILTTKFWAIYRFNEAGYYADRIYYFALPFIALLWSIGFFFQRKVRKRSTFQSLNRAFLYGTLFTLLLYGLISESWRFSRAILLLGAIFSYLTTSAFCIASTLIKGKNLSTLYSTKRKTIISGSLDTCEQVNEKIMSTNQPMSVLGYICPKDEMHKSQMILGSIAKASETIEIYQPDQVLISSNDLGFQNVISIMTNVQSNVDFFLVPKSAEQLLSSVSSHSQGEIVSLELHVKYNEGYNRALKRVFDIFGSLIMIIIYPICMLTMGWKAANWSKLFQVLVGQKTLVGFDGAAAGIPIKNPKHFLFNIGNSTKNQRAKWLNTNIYARDYNPIMDVQFILMNFRNLFT